STTTDASGNYSFSGLEQSGFTVSVSAPTYVTQSEGVTLTSNQTLSFQLQTVQGPSLSSFMRDYIEAIFLGSGPLSPSDGNYGCFALGVWSGFPRGTIVTVRASTTESSDKRQAIENAAAQVSSATLGAIKTFFALTDDADPTPGDNEAVSATYPSPTS